MSPLLRDLFTPLWVGATIAVPPVEPSASPDVLARWIADEKITVVHWTPTLARILCDVADVRWPALRHALFGGEPLFAGDVLAVRRRAPGTECVNYYGANETPQAMGYHTIGHAPSADSEMQSIPLPSSPVPLGRGIDGVQLLVLNEAGQLAGVGELGEIHVRTPYLARGYFGDEELSRARFIDNPFTTVPGDRLYRTGDLGRWRPDGLLDCVGRADRQVKVRG